MRLQTVWVILGLLSSVAFAAPQCSDIDVSITTVEDLGTIYSSSDSSDTTETKFFDVCFVRGGWLIRAPLLVVREDAAGVIIRAENATVEADGATGTIKTLEARGETTNLETIALKLEPSYKIDGFASAKYAVTAQRGQLFGQKLTLQNAIFNKLSESGSTTERYQAASATLENQRATLSQLVFGSPQFGLSAQLGSSSQNGVQLSGIIGLVGRNSAGSEIGFTASSALRLEDTVYQLENTWLNVFGVSMYLGRFNYDPRCPFEVPLVFGVGNGLTLGLENLLLTCDGKTRGTFAIYDAFGKTSTAPFSSITSLGVSVSYVDGTSSYFIGQAKAASFKATVRHEPLSGLTSAFSLDTGARIESNLASLRSAEGRVGVAYNFDWLAPLVLRPQLELGTVAESLAPVTRDFQGFVRGSFGINLNWISSAITLANGWQGQITLSGSWLGRLTSYFGNASLGSVVDYNASLGYAVNFPWFGFAATFANTEQPFASPFVTHNLTPSTTIVATARVTPSFEPASLGLVGLRFESPSVSFGAAYNLRQALWTKQRADLSFALAFYNGSIATDHLGNLFQTPFVSLTPQLNYDLMTNSGGFGASLTYFGLSLAYTVGFDLTLPSGAFTFKAGLRLR